MYDDSKDKMNVTAIGKRFKEEDLFKLKSRGTDKLKINKLCRIWYDIISGTANAYRNSVTVCDNIF